MTDEPDLPPPAFFGVSAPDLGMVLEALPNLVWTSLPDGQCDYLSKQWSQYTGLADRDLLGHGWLDVVHPDDREHTLACWRTAIAAKGMYDLEYRLRRHDGEYRWHKSRGVPIRGAQGELVKWFGTDTDIHDRKLAEDAARFLAEASASLAAVVDYESTLQKVAALAVPQFADWSAVDIAQPDGSLRRLAVVHRDAERVRVAQELARRYPPDLEAAAGIGFVFRTGQPEIMTHVTDELLVSGAVDEDHLRLMRALRLRSYICVPLVVAGKTLGALTFATSESGRSYTHADLTLADDLAHRAAVAVENARLYHELREADRLKDEFLAMLAHELRNPLTPVRNAIYILKQPGTTAGIQEQVLGMAERQIEHMGRLLDDLLDVSRISRGRIELRIEPIDVSSVISRTIEAVHPFIESRRHELTVSLPAVSLWTRADPTRLEQVLTNLLNNAAKYTEPGGKIRLVAERQNDQVILRVRDSGVGLAPDVLPRVFDLFVQAQRRLDRAQGGVGIGLTLVKRLVELHGGTVEAHSAGVGCGSEFIIRLPAIAMHEQTHLAEFSSENQPRVPRRRVLVVDDNADAADSLVLLLQLVGQETQAAYDGPSAIALAEQFKPEIVLLDLGMPGMDGYEVARRLRAMPHVQTALMVALTGWGQEEDRQRSREAGIDEHLVKPVRPDALTAILAS